MEDRVELDCARVRTHRDLAEWAIQVFRLPISVEELPTVVHKSLLFSRRDIDMDSLTSRIYHHLGKNQLSCTVELKNYHSASQDVLAVLSHPRGWRRAFGSGLPHDYGVGVGFEP
ncbi:hypothetical protein GCM10027191_09250 [Novilysobacter erysipheiresistens]|uniref:hypothetical protein n=1 Tax=Novilysobacter erysipheiresistens TaxID=1749332 RepID=UPI002FCAF77B